MKNKLSLLIVVPALLLLGACSTFDTMFTSGDDKPPLKGERISILQLQTQLVANPAIQQTPVVLPDAWTNAFWPQAGGLSQSYDGAACAWQGPEKAWSVSVGSGGDRRDPLITQPVVADGMVFTLDTDGNITAFSITDGKKKWRVSSVPKDEKAGAIGGGIAYAGGKLYVTNGYKQLACFDSATGNMVWRAACPRPRNPRPRSRMKKSSSSRSMTA